MVQSVSELVGRMRKLVRIQHELGSGVSSVALISLNAKGALLQHLQDFCLESLDIMQNLWAANYRLKLLREMAGYYKIPGSHVCSLATWEFPSIRGPTTNPNSRALTTRTPTKRAPKFRETSHKPPLNLPHIPIPKPPLSFYVPTKKGPLIDGTSHLGFYKDQL